MILSGAATALLGLLRPFLSIIVAVALTVVFYEGLSIPLFFTELHLVRGRVDRVRDVADERCRQQKAESTRRAAEADSMRQHEAARAAQWQLEEMAERALAAQARSIDYEREVAAMEPALRSCRLAAESDLRRLRE